MTGMRPCHCNKAQLRVKRGRGAAAWQFRMRRHCEERSRRGNPDVLNKMHFCLTGLLHFVRNDGIFESPHFVRNDGKDVINYGNINNPGYS